MGETTVDNGDDVRRHDPAPPGRGGVGVGEGAHVRSGGDGALGATTTTTTTTNAVGAGAGAAATAAADGSNGNGGDDDVLRLDPAAASSRRVRARTDAQRDNLLLLLGVTIIAACCSCWFLEHLDYLLKPLVFAVGLSLLLRPFVDFISDARYQTMKLRRWNVTPPWSPRTATVPRFVALVLALSVVMLVSATFIWALYLSEQWITYHWKDKPWNDRFIARINDLADFTDRIALRLLKKDDFAVDAWHTLQARMEEMLKEEAFW